MDRKLRDAWIHELETREQCFGMYADGERRCLLGAFDQACMTAGISPIEVETPRILHGIYGPRPLAWLNDNARLTFPEAIKLIKEQL